MTRVLNYGVLLTAMSFLGACNTDSEPAAGQPPQSAAPERNSAQVEKAAESAARPAGKPMAPVSIRYEVVGRPVMGQPVSINLEITSNTKDQPVSVQYRSSDESSVAFPEAQPQAVELGTLDRGESTMQQVTVVPLREGRVYLNVSAAVETSQGTMFRSLAVPIQVGSAPDGADAVNGELTETAEGETVISMPAREQ